MYSFSYSPIFQHSIARFRCESSINVRKLQICKLLGTLCYLKFANFLGLPVRKSQNPQIFMINLQIASLQISTKYCTTLSQNSPKSRLFKQFFIMYKFELEHYIHFSKEQYVVLRTCRSLQITKILGLQIEYLTSVTLQ